MCRRGEAPEADAAEKALLRTARRGVVRLFNAVSKAQKQASEAQAPGARTKVGLLLCVCCSAALLTSAKQYRRTSAAGRDRCLNSMSVSQRWQRCLTALPVGRLQDKQLTQASFLAELCGKSAASAQQKQQAGAPAKAAPGSAPSEQAAATDTPAWEALQDDISSLQSGLRMKVTF